MLLEGLHESIASKSELVEKAALVVGAASSDTSDDLSHVREQLFEDKSIPFAVGRIGILPTQLDRVVAALRDDAYCPFRWRLVIQAAGTALVRMESADLDALVVAIRRFRAVLADLGGSLVLLRRLPEQKQGVDVWGEPGDALPLMKRIEAQFDAAGILNPGRFVGGI